MTLHFFQQATNSRQSCSNAIMLSRDGYIRLEFEYFQQLEMIHLFSGMDDNRPVISGVGANSSAITGFTEWVSHGTPAITIGWDWELIGAQGKACLIQTGIPGRNLMFVNQQGQDLGSEQTSLILVDWLKVFDWQTEALNAISC